MPIDVIPKRGSSEVDALVEALLRGPAKPNPLSFEGVGGVYRPGSSFVAPHKIQRSPVVMPEFDRSVDFSRRSW